MDVFERLARRWQDKEIKAEAYKDGQRDAEYDAMRENAEGHRRAHDVDAALASDPDYAARMRRKYEAEGNDGE